MPALYNKLREKSRPNFHFLRKNRLLFSAALRPDAAERRRYARYCLPLPHVRLRRGGALPQSVRFA